MFQEHFANHIYISHESQYQASSCVM